MAYLDDLGPLGTALFLHLLAFVPAMAIYTALYYAYAGALFVQDYWFNVATALIFVSVYLPLAYMAGMAAGVWSPGTLGSR